VFEIFCLLLIWMCIVLLHAQQIFDFCHWTKIYISELIAFFVAQCMWQHTVVGLFTVTCVMTVLQPQVVGDIGSPNNVLTLSEHDCDVFSALNTDDLTKLVPLPAEKPPDKCPTPPPSMLLPVPWQTSLSMHLFFSSLLLRCYAGIITKFWEQLLWFWKTLWIHIYCYCYCICGVIWADFCACDCRSCTVNVKMWWYYFRRIADVLHVSGHSWGSPGWEYNLCRVAGNTLWSHMARQFP